MVDLKKENEKKLNEQIFAIIKNLKVLIVFDNIDMLMVDQLDLFTTFVE